MKLIDSLERKLGKYAISNLMLYIVGINGFVFLLNLFYQNAYALFVLDPTRIRQGEIWRLITFIFIPPSSNMLFLFFVLYFYYTIGHTLENEWGSFKFNLYYLIGMLGIIAASFITGDAMVSFYLNLSLFFAFARLYPDFTIRLFFILPLKIKYLAYLNWIIFAYTIIVQPLPLKISAVVALLNYFLFFGKDIVTRRRQTAVSYYRKKKYMQDLESAKPVARHRCEVCGRTELDDPNLEFRYCSKCDGYHEYCMDHLYTHEHIKEHKHDEHDKQDKNESEQVDKNNS